METPDFSVEFVYSEFERYLNREKPISPLPDCLQFLCTQKADTFPRETRYPGYFLVCRVTKPS